MKINDEYSRVFSSRKNHGAKPLFFPLDPGDFVDRKCRFSGKIFDFGSAIESRNLKKAIRDGGKYSGFDIDRKSAGWLEKNGYFVDFWKTKEKFDVIVASQVFEHLEPEERERFLERSNAALKKNGLLILEYPFIQNLGGMAYWKDRTHKRPPAVEDEASLLELLGFESETFLVGLSYWPPQSFFRIMLNILIGYHPQHTVVIIARKK